MPTKHRILLVDDHPIVREGVAQLIRREPDLDVCGEAEDAPEAFSLVLRENPDVIIVDLDLKSSSGLDLILQVRGTRSETKILVLSMHDERIYAERALRAGAQGYIMKSEVSRKVVSAIRTLLKGGAAFSDEIKDQLLLQRTPKDGARSGSPVERLSNRELQVFQLTGDGLTNQEIADHLHVSVKTVYKHVERIKEKLNLRSSRELIQQAARWVVDPNRI